VVGEVHGSKETPAAFVRLVDHMLTRTKRVSVGLEMPASAGAAGCGAPGGSLSLGAFWTRKSQDGRSSAAMRQMVCQLKKRAEGGKVRLIYLDSVPRKSDEWVRRASMELASRSSPMLVLIGNHHARNAPASFTDQLRAAGIRVTSLTISSPDATTWSCTQDGCGPRPIRMSFCPQTTMGPYLLARAPAGARWDGCMVLPRLTSSPPAAPRHDISPESQP
jgi:hypothetical protein